MIYAVYDIIEKSPLFIKFVFKHKLNLRSYIEDEIYNEAHREAHNKLSNRNFIARGLNSFYVS